MVWIILAVAALALVFLLFEKSEGISLFFVFLMLPFITISINGILAYPRLLRIQGEVLALKSEIETMRKAYYSERGTPTLIGGSLTNLKQSSVLAEYIQKYANKKANYNGEVQEVQFRKSSRVFFWFGDGLFLSEKGLELKLL